MIRLATQNDLKRIIEITEEVKKEMKLENNPQWDEYPQEEDFLKDIKDNALYVYEEDKICAFASIKKETEKEYQQVKESTTNPSYVIHRLAVDKNYRRKSYAQKLFIFAEELAKKDNIFYIKADTEIHNEKMNQLFLKLGYQKLGTLKWSDNNGTFNYYEKKLSDWNTTYDCIVVGGGHAGCEAAHISAFMGQKTLLITMNLKNIADMPCNPSIGGTAKGVIVREIDALGGLMGKVADRSHFQIKMLNSAKGPAVRSLRAQADKVTYPENMRKELQATKNLEIIEGTVENLIVENAKIKGIVLSTGQTIQAKTIILTTGTYLKSEILIGSEKEESGPHGEPRSNFLSDNLKKLGFHIQRLKTGTPQRLKASTIDFTKMQEEVGDKEYYTFSWDLKPNYQLNEQQKCYLLYTNENTHDIILSNLNSSAMYGGYVTGVGPRYCPSIEDKLVRFKEKERHQLFLEPESLYYDEWYLQGFSTSMPKDIQEQMVHSLKGLEHAEITKYAYAIEYDAIDPLQIKPSLESKIIENLFTAGQINGTSGYEEAAGQGLIAGINASLKIQGKEPLILKRNEAYIGVLIDDLVTKGTKEPYRMLTSRAEYRLILRHDNADLRLRELAYSVKSITEEQYQRTIEKKKKIEQLMSRLKQEKIHLNEETKEKLKEKQIDITKSKSFYDLLKRPEITLEQLSYFLPIKEKKEIVEQVEIAIKYEGYINKTNRDIEKMLKLEQKLIPKDIDYDKIKNIASEAKQKLKQIQPSSIGQAARISGVNPSDISILAIYLKKEYGKNEGTRI